jgi:hypothetical protein
MCQASLGDFSASLAQQQHCLWQLPRRNSKPQVIEVTRDKRVVWRFHDFERFGNAVTNTQVLSVDGKLVEGLLGRDR